MSAESLIPASVTRSHSVKLKPSMSVYIPRLKFLIIIKETLLPNFHQFYRRGSWYGISDTRSSCSKRIFKTVCKTIDRRREGKQNSPIIYSITMEIISQFI
jgi:hypothetical protein